MVSDSRPGRRPEGAPNESETYILCGAQGGTLAPRTAKRYAARLLAAGPENVVIKLGAAGAFWANAAGESAWVPAFRVRAVDSTAGGDAFNAGLAVALMRGEAPREAIRFACAAAALSVTRPGAQPSMPTGDEVNRFVASRPRPA